MFGLSYCKRFRLERDLRGTLPPAALLPEGFYLLPWDDSLVMRHAKAKHEAFCEHYDSALFPCLATLDGCIRLMSTIRDMPGFVPGATWLIANGIDTCGTVQGVRDAYGAGGIQNLGVTPAYRGRGLGGSLMVQAMHGFRAAGLSKMSLEVTAHNEPAVRLYRRLGFSHRRTVYKPVQGPLPLVAEVPALT
ncbi:MAG: GNAT family N-acetyltransferase [Gemmataceae bacterium]